MIENVVLNAVMLASTTPINKEDLFIVWSCYILKNRKFLIGCKTNNNYYEVTYDVNNDRWYVDEYIKNENTMLSNTTLVEYTEINN